MTEAHCRKLIAAGDAASARGTPFNRFITIAWGKCGIDPEDSVAATGAWIKLARDWMRERGYAVPWAWVQECGPQIGAHCHVLIHVPPELAPLLGKRFSHWARLVIGRMGGSYCLGTMVAQKIAFGNAPEASPAAYHAAMQSKVHYMLKCAPAALEERLGMVGRGHKAWGQSCLVYGKRAAVSQGYQDPYCRE